VLKQRKDMLFSLAVARRRLNLPTLKIKGSYFFFNGNRFSIGAHSRNREDE
jgi:hypothetical protein